MSNGGYRRRAGRVDVTTHDLTAMVEDSIRNTQYTDHGAFEAPTRAVRTTTELTGALLLTDEVVYSTLDSAGKAFSLPVGAPVGKSVLLYSQTSGPDDFTVIAPGGGGIITPQTPGSVVSAVAINRYCGRFIHIGSNVWFESGRCPLDVVPTFIITVERTSPGDYTFTVGGTTNNFAIDWGDGTVESVNTAGSKTHAYASAGTYTVMMAGIVEDFSHSYTAGAFLRTVEQFDGALTYNGTAADAFRNCGLYAINADDAPIFGGTAASIEYGLYNNLDFNTFNATGQALWAPPSARMSLFSFCGTFNQPLNGVFLTGATDLSNAFAMCGAYNNGGVDMDSIVVSTGCMTTGMFTNCTAFNVKPPTFTDISISASSMFFGCTLFNQPLTGWALNASVTSQSRMFGDASAFNQDVSHILGSGTLTVSYMFRLATAFKNGGVPLTWSTGAVETWTQFMLNCAFDQAILVNGGFDFTSAKDCSYAFSSATAYKFNNGGVPVYIDFGNSVASRVLDLTNMFAGSNVPATITLVLPTEAATTVILTNTFNYANFNDDLGAMDIRRVAFNLGTFSSTSWSQANFEATLIGWGITQAATVPSSRLINTLAGLGLYVPVPGTTARTAYDALVVTKSWTINGLLGSPMVMTWDQTPADGFVSLQIGGTFSVRVDWDDGAGFGAPTSSAPSNTYSSATATRSIRVLTVSGTPTFTMNGNTSTMKLKTVENWGGVHLAGAGLWFDGVTTLTAINAVDAPVLTGATSMAYAFRGTTGLATFSQTGLDAWVVPSARSMSYAFAMCKLSGVTFGANWFNNPSDCDYMFGDPYGDNDDFNCAFSPSIVIPSTARVEGLFCNCRVFNNTPPGLSTTAGRTSLRQAFRRCAAFNQPLPASWLTATTMQDVTNFSELFQGCTVFNQNLGPSFVQSAATNMKRMFQEASAFNNGGSGDIGSWNTANVVDFSQAFFIAPAFNQNILGSGKWSLAAAEDTSFMFTASTAYANGGAAIDYSLGSTDRTIAMNGMFIDTALTDAVAFGGTVTLPSGGGTAISMWELFSGCNNAAFTGAGIQSGLVNNRVTHIGGMFANCTYFTGDTGILAWDVSGVTHFRAAEGIFNNTPAFDQPIMEQTAWGGKMTTAVLDTRDMFSGTTAFTNGGQPIYWHPTAGTTANPLRAGRMFGGNTPTITQAVDITFGPLGDTSSVNLEHIGTGGLGLAEAVNNATTSDWSGTELARVTPGQWSLSWGASGSTLANFEASVIYWDNADDQPAQGILAAPSLSWASLSGAAQTAVTSLISNGWTITPHP